MQTFGSNIWNGIITLEDTLTKKINFKKKLVILKILLYQNTKIKRKEKYYLIKTQVKLGKEKKKFLTFFSDKKVYHQKACKSISSKVLCTFVPNKSFGQLLEISTKSFILLKTFSLEVS